ncbi:MAG: o-succinylbenzoate synthase [Rhodothermia bacterium]|nr:MAG: o-succinylbenzoate synthase [Rhodothermia bacterium]
MHIVSAEIFHYSKPVLSEFPAAGDSTEQAPEPLKREGLLIRIISGTGSESWGEVAPLPGRSRESLNEATSAVMKILPSLAGLKLAPSFEEWTVPNLLEGLPSSCIFGIEQAIYGLSSAECSVPLSEWLREDSRSHVAVNALLDGSNEEVLAQAREGRRDGYGAFKLKVGTRRVDQEAKLVAEVRSTIGADAELRLDANRAWDFDTAVHFLSEMEDQNIAYIEEPLANPAFLSRISQNSAVPIALDESIVEVFEQDQSLKEYSFACAAILKPTLIGGMAATLDLAERFYRVGVEPVITSCFETEVGHAGLVSLAAAISGSGWAAGLDTLRYFDSDLPPEPVRAANQISLYEAPEPSRLTRVV